MSNRGRAACARHRLAGAWTGLLACLTVFTPGLTAAGTLRFQIRLDPSVAPRPVSGRLFVLMSDDPAPRERLSTGFRPGGVWLAAVEVDGFSPGAVYTFDPDVQAYPRPFSQARRGDYQFMALLDPDHSYALKQQDGGDLYGPVVAVRGLDPASVEPVALTLSKVTPSEPEPADTERVRRVEIVSTLLSAFWGRPITMRAGVVLPLGYADDAQRRYPTAYGVHGFGGSYLTAWDSPGTSERLVRVFLDGSFPTGHHEFADSVNNGPWGRALVEELIPHLETRFRLLPRASARLLTGHSSGGWSTLWLQITYPDFFGGTWSTAPDPVDLRSFTGIDATPGSTQNAYRTRDGKPINLIRQGGKELATLEEFARQEAVRGEYGGQYASFEWVWGPRGPDGRPMRLFDRKTGEQDPRVQQAWQKYDIRAVLEREWGTLGPKLDGKLHLVVGTEDTFHLEEPARYLCDFLKGKGRATACEFVPGRDHSNLYRSHATYPHGLARRIEDEMLAVFDKAERR